MLKHEDNPETSSRPAAHVRVTPEELAQALSRIEARKDSGQRNIDGTISIGEAVQQLGVDTTPEEVLAEVQALRQEPMRAKKQRPSSRQRLALLSGTGLGLIGLVGWWSVTSHTAQVPAPPAVAITLPEPQAMPKPISLDPNLIVGDATGKLVMLSEVGNNKPVECTYRDGTFQPYSPSDGATYVVPVPTPWTLSKHGGQVYIRGWIPRMSYQAFESGADISSWNHPGFDVPVTLPVGGFDIVPGADSNGAGDDTEFHAVNIHLDKYAHEKWKPWYRK